jgi:hypothetical protein
MNSFSKINRIVEMYMTELGDIEDNTEEQGIVNIFYSDLDMEGKKKVLQAIDESFDYIDVFSDDVVRNNIEEALSKRPIITLTGKEIVNKTNIDI